MSRNYHRLIGVKVEGKLTIQKIQDRLPEIREGKFETLDLSKIEYADPVFYAWLYLFNKHRKFRYKLPREDGNEEKGRIHQLSLWLDRLKEGSRPLTILKCKRGWGEWSRRFLPLFLVNNETYSRLFGLTFGEIWRKVNADPEAFENCLKRISKKEQWSIVKTLENCVDGSDVLSKDEKLVFVYFINSIIPFRLARKLVDKLLNRNDWEKRPSRLGIAKKDKENKYEIEGWNLIEKFLFPQPVFCTFLFSLYSQNFIERKPESIDLLFNSLYQALRYCQRFSKGIEELAKNIVEHAGNSGKKGEGFIVVRVFHEKSKSHHDKYADFMQDIKNIVNGKHFFKKGEGVFLVYIIDNGEQGILKTSIEKLLFLKRKIGVDNFSSTIMKAMVKDVDNLSNGKITLKDFFDYKNSQLLYQRIRASAGMGLFTFFNLLLEESKGFAVVSTPDNKQFQSLLMYNKTWTEEESPSGNSNVLFEEIETPLFSIGTSYLIALPVSKGTDFGHSQSTVTLTMRIPKKSEGDVLYKSFVEHGFSPLPVLKVNKNTISYITKNERMWEFIKSEWDKLKNELGKGELKYLCVNVEGSFNASDVINLLSMIEIITKVSGIIVIGVREETIMDMLRTLRIYDNIGWTVWDENQFVLFFASSPLSPLDVPVGIHGKTFEDLLRFNEELKKRYHTDYWVKRLMELTGEWK